MLKRSTSIVFGSCTGCATPCPTCRKAQQSMASAALRQAFLQPDQRERQPDLAPRRRPAAPEWPKLGAFMDESEDDVLAYMDFPAQHRTKLHSHEPAGTPEQGGQAPRRRRRHLPLRSLDHPPDRRRAARGQRRVAAAAPLHAGVEAMGEAQPALPHRCNPATSTEAA